MGKVVFIMTDGLRPDAINNDNTPNLVQFMERGSYTMSAQSIMPSVTLPCHTSIFHSVPATRHGILENKWKPFVQPATGLVTQIHNHKKKAGFVHNWDAFRDLSLPEHLYFSFYIGTAYQFDGDNIIGEAACKWIPEGICDFWFVYFTTIDLAGHKHGWMTDGYFEQVRLVDGLVGDLLSVIDDETTVIIHSDHGGHDRTHGTDMPEDMIIPYMVAGPNVKQNYEIQSEVSLLDTTPTVAHILDIPQHSDWEGNVISEVFES